MLSRRWLSRLALFAAASAAAGPCALPGLLGLPDSLAVAQNAPAAPLADPTPELERQAVDALLARLRNRNARADQREEDARRLLRRTAPQTRAAVIAAFRALLRSDDRDGRLAVARAVAAEASPDPSLADDLATMLGLDRTLAPAAAQALAAFKGNRHAFDLLAQFAARSGPNTSAPTRTAAIRAMGRFVEKYAAQALVQLLSDRTPAVRTAAAAALIEMTGLAEFDNDAQRWQQWMQAGAGRSDEQWKADLIAPRSARQDREREQYADLRAEMEVRLSSLFLATPNEKKQELMMGLLGSASPDVRAMGSGLASQFVKESGRLENRVKDRLIDLVSDPSVRVRAAAVDSLGTISYERALDALLVQLAIEPDSSVRTGIVNVLGRIGGTRQVPALLARLADPSPDVRERVARALEQLGGDVRQVPALSAATAERLRAAINQPDGGDAETDDRLRDAYTQAVAPLLAPDVLANWGTAWVNDRRPPLRRVGYRLLGLTDDPRLAARVVQGLPGERDPAVRAQALVSAGRLVDPAERQIFLQYMSPAENSPEVREAAWQGLQALLPKMAPNQLLATAVEPAVRREPEKELLIRQQAADKLRAANDLVEWARQKLNLANLYMQLDRADAAAPQYREVLDYYRGVEKRPVEDATVERLSGDLVTALLRARQFAEAAQRAADTTRASAQPSPRKEVGDRFAQEADRLYNDFVRGGDVTRLNDAAAVVSAGLAVDPPLLPLSQARLKDVQERIERQRANGANNTRLPPANRRP